MNEQLALEEEIWQAIDQFFAQAEEPASATIAQFTAYSGISENRLHKVLQEHRWYALCREYAVRRLRSALEELLGTAKTKDDITLSTVAARAGTSIRTAHRLFATEIRDCRAKLPSVVEYNKQQMACEIRPLVDQFFAQAKEPASATIAQFAAYSGISKKKLLKLFPRSEWVAQRRDWMVHRLREVMKKLFYEAKTRQDFTIRAIGSRAEISEQYAKELIGEEFQEYQAKLPSAAEYNKQQILTTLMTMVEENVPIEEFTRRNIIARSGVYLDSYHYQWFREAFNKGYIELENRNKDETIEEYVADHLLKMPDGGVVDLDCDVWKLTCGNNVTLRREHLRPDLAEIAWSLMREKLHSGEYAVRTIECKYRGYRYAGQLLGDGIPDIRRATLRDIQTAWTRYEGSPQKRIFARQALSSLFERLYELSRSDLSLNQQEILMTVSWLDSAATVPVSISDEEFLSALEVDALIKGCLKDIAAGIAFTDGNPDFMQMTTNRSTANSAGTVVLWSYALMMLVALGTGLRSESVSLLTIDDWVDIRKGLFALAWRHSKKNEEKACYLPAAIAQQLDLYVQRTSAVREALGTRSVFLVGSGKGIWKVVDSKRLSYRGFADFANRHNIKRDDGTPLKLNCQILRRTYVTRALDENVSINAVQGQLGHGSIATTFRYAKFERFEHPKRVEDALNSYGRKVLMFWSNPCMLDELPPDERAALLSEKLEHDQEVGLCRNDHCVKAVNGSPPPCSLCEHLVTGPEFIGAWWQEFSKREQELQMLAAKQGAEMILAQMRAQFDQFTANLEYMIDKCKKDGIIMDELTPQNHQENLVKIDINYEKDAKS